jgi:hypothetical protein
VVIGSCGNDLSPLISSSRSVALDRRALAAKRGDPERVDQRTLGWAAAAPTAWAEDGRLRTLHAIYAPLITSTAAPAGTVGGVLAGPIV